MSKILFLGCNFNQLPYLQVLKKRDYYIVGTDSNDHAPGRGLCDQFYPVGYDNIQSLIDIGDKEGFAPDDYAFTAAAQFAHRGAAAFCEQFNIGYPSISTIELCLDKSLFYKYFQEHGIPIPQTFYVQNQDELRQRLENFPSDTRIYLKSDFSKNPHYVYNFSTDIPPWDEIFWGNDRYLRKHYILQKEFSGTSLRFNIYGARFNVFDFQSGQRTTAYHETINSLGILQTLQRLLHDQGLEDWLVKFDVILKQDSYVVLDIGLDPPYRMVKWSQANGIDFARHYINQYIDGDITYPVQLDGI